MTKKRNYQTEEQKELIKFAIVLVVVIAFVIAFYFISKVFIKKEAPEYSYQTGEVSTDVVIVGTMLQKPENEYYVLAYDYDSDFAPSYNVYASYYKSNQENALKIYHLNLKNVMNQNYYVTENSNPNAKNIKDLRMIDGTLIKIKNGKITKYLEGIENISKELKVSEK